MTKPKSEDCFHSQFTGYQDYCVCIHCGWIIQYEDIKLEKNDASLENYITTTLEQIDSKDPNTEVSFDIGVTPQGLVNDQSLNRVKFTLRK